MRTALGLASHAILADQDANGKENAFGGNEERQNAEGKRIEGFHAGNQVEIESDPDHDHDHVEREEFDAADKFYDGIAVALGAGAAIESFLFELGNGGDVELRGVFCNLVGNGFVHAGDSGSAWDEVNALEEHASDRFEIHFGVTALV
jgi:hypothetical protein